MESGEVMIMKDSLQFLSNHILEGMLVDDSWQSSEDNDSEGLVCLSGVSYKTILEDTEQYTGFKGAFTENYVLTELIVQGSHPYFWRSGNTAELDFLLEDEDRIIPIKAKAEIRTRAKSYSIYCSKYKPKLGFKFSMKNVGDHIVGETVTYSVPLYLIWKLKQYLD